MAHKLSSTATFEDFEDEILFTRAALKADEDAVELLPETDGWLPLVDAARQQDRTVRQAVAEIDALRSVANLRLDSECIRFADDLLVACGRDRSATRFTQFFAKPVSRFVRQPLADQIAAVRGWLASSKDAVLEQHRAALDKRVAGADSAVVQTRGLATLRGENWQRREQLAEDLTRERDGLQALLAQRGRERGLPRDWPDAFFRTASRTPATTEEAVGVGPTPA